MDHNIEWEYYVASCWYQVTKQKLIGSNEGHWIIELDNQEYGLSKGLAEFGKQGWELVTVHPTRLPTGGGTLVSWERPSHFYIFKRARNHSQ